MEALDLDQDKLTADPEAAAGLDNLTTLLAQIDHDQALQYGEVANPVTPPPQLHPPPAALPSVLPNQATQLAPPTPAATSIIVGNAPGMWIYPDT